ncbi:4a-hydroxytetrahydrobiopterin dehydratase [Tenuibacillus multivorans]|uniref:Putative pterin-4-alpha-carbinolamine dehydratase n=1 Tax=Tenuibacillus multivorans TaxID=237069 RepID=A0A1G9WNZ8_9BACI|nr:4a-hydroxytetrahydrobiopterin dehydratase [Tenuibacillus multivorans]GEL77991.1 4a-hydroxytetrahydrobiopterin dehydratase [Tenuibacillus multivorans]SDM86117.1 4a-hydroxytetrahydrobiopterin dehydratase [Tenuibacillus multivorans]
MERLSDEQVQQELDKLPNWKLVDEKWIRRRYKFKDYLDGVEFVRKVAEYAESKNHHPNIAIDYKVVTLKISSWEMRGLTDLDFEMVHHFDELYEG